MYRPLNHQEIALLEARGCTADDWSRVEVAPGFRPESLLDVHLSGTIRLGVMDGTVRLLGDVDHPCGIRHARLHDVTVGDRCCIEHVRGHIAGYTIGHDTLICDSGPLVATGDSRFGQGVEACVVDESGSRPVYLFDRLSAPLAWIMVQAARRPALQTALKGLVERYADLRRQCGASVGNYVEIIGAGTLCDVCVGDYCSILGASCLTDGTIASTASAPASVGQGVVCEDFILCSGSNVDAGARLRRCFVGQACELGGAFTATDSVFFANCRMEHGEACAAFCGPYSVSHHRSTLLIAGMFSFMNAGSGSNQSNHAYKLGPIHYGLAERGVKLASDSYLLWPAAVGAFSVVSGRITSHPDARLLPFSPLSGGADGLTLTPGATLRSIGTLRDAYKWPRRDGRTDPEGERLDPIHYPLLNPYTVGRMMEGCRVLDGLRRQAPTARVYTYRGMTIPARAVERGLHLYDMAILAYLGRTVAYLIEGRGLTRWAEYLDRLKPKACDACEPWVDLAGMLLPRAKLEEFTRSVSLAQAGDAVAVVDRLQSLYHDYDELSASWACRHLPRALGLPAGEEDPARARPADLIALLRRWREAEEEWLGWIRRDAGRDQALSGIGGSYFDDLPPGVGGPEPDGPSPPPGGGFPAEYEAKIAYYLRLADELIAKLSVLSDCS